MLMMLLAVPLPNAPIHLVANGMLMPAMWFGARMEGSSRAMALAEPAEPLTEAAVAPPAVAVVEPAAPEALLEIPGGDVRVCFDPEKKCDATAVGPFLMSRTEVTVAEFRACLEAGKCQAEHFETYEYSRFCNLGAAGRADHPMNCVRWEGARDYCAFAGMRLPSFAEWLQASGGAQGRTYPWGDTAPDCTLAAYHSREGRGCGTDATFPADSLPGGASPHGVLHMSGNVIEWTFSTHSTCEAEPVNEEDRARMEGETLRYVAGGSFADDATVLVVDKPNLAEQETKSIGMGIRCAEDLP